MATGLDMDLARRAYEGISMTPEVRAQQVQQEFVGHMADLRERMTPLAETEAQRAILAEEIATYQARYLRFLHAELAAKSRVLSTFITGPANFPSRRNAKRMHTEDKRREEMQEWIPKAQAAIRRRLLAARTPERQEDAELARLKRDIDRNMATVQGIDRGDLPYYRQAFVTGSVEKIRRVAGNGNLRAAAEALAYVAQRQADWKKPFITRRNAIWQVVEQAEAQIAAEAEARTAAPTGEEETANLPGLRAVRNHDADRLQLFFDGKPDDATRQQLKSSGWNWSPSNGCWQRKITPNAEYALARFLEGRE